MTRPGRCSNAIRWAAALAGAAVLASCALPAAGPGEPPTGIASSAAVSRATASAAVSVAEPSAAVSAAAATSVAGPTADPIPDPTSVAATRRSPAAETNYRLAAAEAHRLHDLASVPPGAVLINRQPDKLGGSAIGTTDSGSLIDVASFWAVPMSQRDSDAWIVTHPPAGLVGDFSSPGIGGPAPSDIVVAQGFTAPNAPAWSQATLQESVAVADAHHSYWRVEGEAIWLDPTPMRIAATGPTMRVIASGRCPGADSEVEGVRNQGSALDTALLPAGRPTAALVCRYDGGNGHPFALVTSQHLPAAAATELATGVRGISLAHDASNPVHSCPADDGAAAVIAFAYPGLPDTDLWVRTNGCTTISNGWIITAGNPLG